MTCCSFKGSQDFSIKSGNHIRGRPLRGLVGKITLAPERFRILIIYPLIGVIAGVAVIGFSALYSVVWWFTEEVLTVSHALIFILLVIGLTGSYAIVHRFAIDKSTGCGTHSVLETYHFGGGNLPFRDALIKTLASVITMGFGGSAGLEGPSLLLGGGIASEVARRLKLGLREAKIILLCGAAAGLSAIFKAPLTGVLFALEVPYQRDIAKEAFVPAAISSVVAYLVVVMLTGPEILFPTAVRVPLTAGLIAHSVAVGLMAAFCGVAFVWLFTKLHLGAKKMAAKPYLRAIVGGLVVAAIGFIIPQSLSVGYETINALTSGEINEINLLLAILVAKIVATCITLDFGGSGGIFIPSIFVGAVLGTAYSMAFLGSWTPILVAAAMAATLTATNKTLLTGVAFVAETMGSSFVIPALLACVFSFLASGRFSFYRDVQPPEKLVEEEEELSVLLHTLAKRGKLPILSRIRVSQVMRRRPISLHASMTVEEALAKVRRYPFRVYPVIDEKGVLIGYVDIEDLVPESGKGLKLSEIQLREPFVVTENEDLSKIAEEMIETGMDHVYVVSDKEASKKLIGVVSEIDIIKKLIELL